MPATTLSRDHQPSAHPPQKHDTTSASIAAPCVCARPRRARGAGFDKAGTSRLRKIGSMACISGMKRSCIPARLKPGVCEDMASQARSASDITTTAAGQTNVKLGHHHNRCSRPCRSSIVNRPFLRQALSCKVVRYCRGRHQCRGASPPITRTYPFPNLET